MIKKFFLSFLVLGLCGAIAVTAYFYFFKPQRTAWMAIPETAVFVIDLDDVSILKTPAYKTVETLFLKNDGVSHFKTIINSINKELQHKYKTSLDEYIHNTSITASFHNLGNDTLNLLATLPLSPTAQSSLHHLKEVFEKSASFRFRVNSYNGTDVYEFTDVSINKNFFLYIKDDLLLIASNRDLLINASVSLDQGGGKLYEQKKNYLKNEIKLEEALLYLNYPNLIRYATSLVDDEEITELAYLADHAFLDVSVTTNQVFLHGFSLSIPENVAYLNSFEDQTPGRFSMGKLLLTQTAKLSYYYIDNYTTFHERLNTYYAAHHNGEYLEHYTSESLNFHPEEFYSLIEPQIAMAWVKNNIGTLDKYFYLKATQLETCKDLLLAQDNAQAPQTYDGHKIYHNAITQLPRLLLGDVFHSWHDSYFTIIEGFFVFAETEQSLKVLINELNADHNWNKAIGKNITNDEAFLNHNLGVYLNPGVLMTLDNNNLSAKAKQRVEELKSSLNQIDLISLQYSQEKNKTYTTLLLKLENSTAGIEAINEEEQTVNSPAENTTTKLKSLFETQLSKGLISKPYLVKNHNDKSFYTLVQDSAFVLHYIANSGKEIWNHKLEAPLVSPIYQVDLYKNNKVQYLFATTSGVSCLDINGNTVENFPVQFKNENIVSLNVIDYENNNNYRLAINTNRNHIYLCNAEGKTLEGWNPQKTIGPLASTVQHFRIGSKDYIGAIEKQGIVHLYSRNGKHIKGFPIELKQEIVSDFFVQSTKDKKEKELIMVSQQGRIIGVTTKGDLNYINQMPEGSQFQLFSDPSLKLLGFSNGESYFNQKGELVFNLLAKQCTNFQLFELSNKTILSYNAPLQANTYICSQNGTAILDSLPSQHEIGLLYSSTGKKYLFYTANKTKLTKWRFEE